MRFVNGPLFDADQLKKPLSNGAQNNVIAETVEEVSAGLFYQSLADNSTDLGQWITVNPTKPTPNS